MTFTFFNGGVGGGKEVRFFYALGHVFGLVGIVSIGESRVNGARTIGGDIFMRGVFGFELSSLGGSFREFSSGQGIWGGFFHGFLSSRVPQLGSCHYGMT